VNRLKHVVIKTLLLMPITALPGIIIWQTSIRDETCVNAMDQIIVPRQEKHPDGPLYVWGTMILLT
jgi:hypothetical protein